MTRDDDWSSRLGEWQPRTAAQEWVVRRRLRILWPIIAVMIGVAVATLFLLRR